MMKEQIEKIANQREKLMKKEKDEVDQWLSTIKELYKEDYRRIDDKLKEENVSTEETSSYADHD